MPQANKVTISEDSLRSIIKEMIEIESLILEGTGTVLLKRFVQKWGTNAGDKIFKGIVKTADDGWAKWPTRTGPYLMASVMPITSLTRKFTGWVGRSLAARDVGWVKKLLKFGGARQNNPFWIINRMKDGTFRVKHFFTGGEEAIREAIKTGNFNDILSDAALTMKGEGSFSVFIRNSAKGGGLKEAVINLGGPGGEKIVIGTKKVSTGAGFNRGTPDIITIMPGARKSLKDAVASIDDLQLVKKPGGSGFATIGDITKLSRKQQFAVAAVAIVPQATIETIIIGVFNENKHILDQMWGSGMAVRNLGDMAIADVFSSNLYATLLKKQQSLHGEMQRDGENYPIALGGKTFWLRKAEAGPGQVGVARVEKSGQQVVLKEMKDNISALAIIFRENKSSTMMQDMMQKGADINDLEALAIAGGKELQATLAKGGTGYIAQVAAILGRLAVLINTNSKADMSLAVSEVLPRGASSNLALNISLLLNAVENDTGFFRNLLHFASGQWMNMSIGDPRPGDEDIDDVPETIEEQSRLEGVDATSILIKNIQTMGENFKKAGIYYVYENDEGVVSPVQGFDPVRSGEDVSVTDIEQEDIDLSEFPLMEKLVGEAMVQLAGAAETAYQDSVGKQVQLADDEGVQEFEDTLDSDLGASEFNDKILDQDPSFNPVAKNKEHRLNILRTFYYDTISSRTLSEMEGADGLKGLLRVIEDDVFGSRLFTPWADGGLSIQYSFKVR